VSGVRELRMALDPAALFANVVGKPDPWQVSALRSGSKRQLYLASRQSGKSSVAAVRGLHRAMYEPRSLILLVSPSLPQSQEIFRKCLTYYRELGRPHGVRNESALRLELGNRSRIISLPGSEKTGVGYSADLIVVDEAAETPSQLIEAMLPSVAVTEGSIVALTSPKGARGWFYELWTQPEVEEVWERYLISADECPRITEEIIAGAQMTRGPRHVRQEYYCSFEADEAAFFNPEDLERSLTLAHDDMAICVASTNWWANLPQPGRTRFLGPEHPTVKKLLGYPAQEPKAASDNPK
jgi:Terminase large subunit, T4likevirus-type, N-terminal